VRLFKQVLERAGLRDQRFHDLRHCTASLFVAWGVDLALVSKLLRHAGLSITADVYSTLYAHTAHELAERMGSFIQQARLAERAN
jgi:integrase